MQLPTPPSTQDITKQNSVLHKDKEADITDNTNNKEAPTHKHKKGEIQKGDQFHNMFALLSEAENLEKDLNQEIPKEAHKDQNYGQGDLTSKKKDHSDINIPRMIENKEKPTQEVDLIVETAKIQDHQNMGMNIDKNTEENSSSKDLQSKYYDMKYQSSDEETFVPDSLEDSHIEDTPAQDNEQGSQNQMENKENAVKHRENNEDDAQDDLVFLSDGNGQQDQSNMGVLIHKSAALSDDENIKGKSKRKYNKRTFPPNPDRSLRSAKENQQLL
ncbi:hypothetical protein CASFOL_018550 [Castilleja foliolosa]|uniref:Uncharacterized protein n=1 Tax=Castilleja foliolosa TaxID=1961234 RepID=A0ABD3D9E8_9LAMI